MEDHLTASDVDWYTEKEHGAAADDRIEKHLQTCSMCRDRVSRESRFERLLSSVSRTDAPRDLSSRINAAVELRLAQERSRRERLPLIGLATCLSALVTLWFGLQMLIGLQEDGALDLFSLVTSHPEVFSAYSTDTLFALLEALPISEMVLTLFALLTVLVLAQQWVDTLRPDMAWYRHGQGQNRLGVR